VADLDATAARRYAFQRPGGVVIASVQPYGPADRKRVVEGLRLVAIDRTEVRSAREARTLLRAIERGQVVTLLLEGPDGRTVIATLRHP
jgi:S1-C subfamily serine protease